MLLGLFFMLCFVAVVVISIGTTIIRGVLNAILGLFGTSKHSQPYGNEAQPHRTRQQSQSQQSAPSRDKRREKVFDKTDGEYVDFEEIKE